MSTAAYSESRWRNWAAPIIARILAETVGQSDREIRKALRDAYPFGPRKYHPYKIWCDEIRRQRAERSIKFVTYNPGEKIVFPDAPIGPKASSR